MSNKELDASKGDCCRKGISGCYCKTGGRPKNEMCPDCKDRTCGDTRSYCVCTFTDAIASQSRKNSFAFWVFVIDIWRVNADFVVFFFFSHIYWGNRRSEHMACPWDFLVLFVVSIVSHAKSPLAKCFPWVASWKTDSSPRASYARRC